MYELAQVEQVGTDDVFTAGNITVVMEPIVVDHLERDIVIEYKSNYGYILKNSFEILTFGMKLVK